MKHFFSLFLLSSLVLGSCGGPVDVPEDQDAGGDDRLSSDYPVIYATVFTHVEQPNGKETPDFLADEEAFWEARELVVTFAEMLYEKGVAYDFQSDWNFLAAALEYDQGTESTNGKNFLRYLAEDLNVSVDPHNHTGQSEYNSADVAYLIDALGVEPSGVVGGFIAAPLSESILEDYWEPVEGNVYDYTWSAEILWGGGTGLHQGDEEDLWASGVWKVGSAEDFLTHDENAPLPVVGHWQTDWEGLDDLLEKQAAGELEMDQIYTISIDAHQKKLSSSFIEEFAAAIDSYQAVVDEGQLQWATFPEVVEIWETQYDSVPSILPYDGEGKEEYTDECGDGVCSLFERKAGNCSADCS